MSARTHPIQTEPLPTKPSLIPLPRGPKSLRVKWIKWMLAAGLAALSAAGALLWRAHLQNAITYQTVAAERGAVQARITATGNLNAVVDVLVSSLPEELPISTQSRL